MELKRIVHMEEGKIKEIYTGFIDWVSDDEFNLLYRLNGKNVRLWCKKDYWKII